jgi:hypothetical protein
MSDPNNTLQYVGTIVKDDGTSQHLTEDELTNYFSMESNMNSNQSSEFCILQVNLRPYDGTDQIVKASYQSSPNGNGNGNGNENFQLKVQTTRGSRELSTLPESSFICDQCTIFTKDILKALRFLNPTDAVTALEVEFVLDDNQHIWLSRAPRVECQSAPSLNSEIGTQPNHNHQISCHLLCQSYQILRQDHSSCGRRCAGRD